MAMPKYPPALIMATGPDYARINKSSILMQYTVQNGIHTKVTTPRRSQISARAGRCKEAEIFKTGTAEQATIISETIHEHRAAPPRFSAPSTASVKKRNTAKQKLFSQR